MKTEEKLRIYIRKSQRIMPLVMLTFILSMLCLGIPVACLSLFAVSLMLFGAYCYFKRMISKCKKEIKQGIILTENVKHVYGLPLAEKTPCKLIFTEDCCVITAGEGEYILNYEKIVAGGKVSGLLDKELYLKLRGCSEKDTVYPKDRNYLVIDYVSNGEITAIILEVENVEEEEKIIREHIKGNLFKYTSENELCFAELKK